MSRIDEIKARAEAAGPGPWAIGKTAPATGYWPAEAVIEYDGMNIFSADENRIPWATLADAEFIAHAREDIPWLLAEIERLS